MDAVRQGEVHSGAVVSEHTDKPTAKAWSELVWFAECPNCEESVELGTGVSFSEGAEATCAECGTEFLLPKQDNG